MFKSVFSLFCVCLLSVSALFAATPPPPNMPPPGMPPRIEKFDDFSPGAQVKLARAEHILGTLIPNPQDYHLILSSKTSFGGEAVPPMVFSDLPTIILYQGSLSPNRSNEEIAFMMAHELGHLNLHHMEKMDQQMEKIFNSHPIEISGTTFTIFYQKFQEQEADLYGLALYKQAGYDLNFFPQTLSILHQNPNLHYGSHKFFKKEISSLSMKDSHFSMKDRFELLVVKAQQSV